MPKQQPNLAALLANSAGSARRPTQVSAQELAVPANPQSPKGFSSAHKGVKPITVHFPQRVRDQIKIIAAEQGRSMQSLIAEAYNDLFAKYGKPEIAPRDSTPAGPEPD